MRYWILIAILVVILVLVFTKIAHTDRPAGQTEIVTKKLGDINGDGKTEIAREEISWGASTCFTTVKILSGKKVLLTLPVLAGNTADAYKVVGKKIVVWRGDWNAEESKWKPHPYDFVWYKWNAKRGKFEIDREGFTKKFYEYKKAKKLMPKLAAKPGSDLVLSKSATFALEAGQLASKRYNQKLVLVLRYDSIPKDSRYGCCYTAELARKKGSPVILVEVAFCRNGSREVEAVVD